MRTRGALASGLGVVALVGLIVGFWDGLHAWYIGYRFIWLPEGTDCSSSINASGEVALVLRLEPLGTWAGRWSLATREVLPLDVPVAGGEGLMALAINDAGDIAGVFFRTVPPWGNVRPFLWSKAAGVRDFPTLGGQQTGVTAINERGQVVGWSTSPPNTVARAFLCSAESGIADLGSLAPEKQSVASAINDAGWVVGSATAANGSNHPFLWKPETGMQDLGLPSGFSGGDARNINDPGEVLVNLYTKSPALGTPRYTPFVWREKDGLVKLPAPPGFNNVSGEALNNRGTVLLQAFPSYLSQESTSYLIVNGVLKELPVAPGAKSTRYCGLNDKGWLVGSAQMDEEGTQWRGFVALPVR